MSRYIDIDKLEPDTEWDDYTDGYISYSSRQIFEPPFADVIPTDKLRSWLTTMRDNINEEKTKTEKRYGSDTGFNDYYKGYISAISYLEGSLAEWKQSKQNTTDILE